MDEIRKSIRMTNCPVCYGVIKEKNLENHLIQHARQMRPDRLRSGLATAGEWERICPLCEEYQPVSGWLAHVLGHPKKPSPSEVKRIITGQDGKLQRICEVCQYYLPMKKWPAHMRSHGEGQERWTPHTVEPPRPRRYVVDESGVVHTFNEWRRDEQMGESPVPHPVMAKVKKGSKTKKASGSPQLIQTNQKNGGPAINKSDFPITPKAHQQSSGRALVECPQCKVNVYADALERHLANFHPGKKTIDQLTQVSKPMQNLNGKERWPICSFCHFYISPDELQDHTLECQKMTPRQREIQYKKAKTPNRKKFPHPT